MEKHWLKILCAIGMMSVFFSSQIQWGLFEMRMNHHHLGENNSPTKRQLELMNQTTEVYYHSNFQVDSNSTKLSLESKHPRRRKMLYIITPTFKRITQAPELTRLCQTLMHVEDMLWIVVEDHCCVTKDIKDLLRNCGAPSVYLTVPKRDKRYIGKGARPRNTALLWLRSNVTFRTSGVVYFADDDNTFDLRIFEKIRSTRRVSVFPVGLVDGAVNEKPIVRNNIVVDWKSLYKPKGRIFATDMAGFAFHTSLLYRKPMPIFNSTKTGFMETDFISNLGVRVEDLEPMGDQVLVWHTKTVPHRLDPRAQPEYRRTKGYCKC